MKQCYCKSKILTYWANIFRNDSEFSNKFRETLSTKRQRGIMTQMNSPKNNNNTLLISPSYFISSSFFDNFKRRPVKRDDAMKNESTMSNPVEINRDLKSAL